jgi:hypothetical protein
LLPREAGDELASIKSVLLCIPSVWLRKKRC